MNKYIIFGLYFAVFFPLLFYSLFNLTGLIDFNLVVFVFLVIVAGDVGKEIKKKYFDEN